MKTFGKKLLSMLLVAMLLVSAIPFQAFAFGAGGTASVTIFEVRGDNAIDCGTVQVNLDDYATEEDMVKALFSGEYDRYVLRNFGGEYMLYIYVPVEEDPTEPTEPEQPTEPEEDPTDPTEPEEDPTDPTEPEEDPTDPTEPEEDPTDPTEPEEDPTDPTEPEEDPTEPEESNTLIVDIYEVDKDNNAVMVKSVSGVDPTSFATTDAMVNSIYGKNWSKYSFRNFGDGTAMLMVWAVETPAGQQVFKLRIQHNDGTSKYTLIDIYEGAGILSTINAAGVKLTYAEHKFVGWSFSHTGNADSYINVYHKANASLANDKGVITIYADWEKITDDDNDGKDAIYDVELKLYVNGKTSSVAKTINMDNYGIDGRITRGEVELAVSKYYNTANMNFYGLFTETTWKSGKYDADDGVAYIDLDPDHTNYIYVMVKNVTSNGNGTADPTNPKTGDYILPVSMTIMVLSGLAAAAVYVAGKKRKI